MTRSSSAWPTRLNAGESDGDVGRVASIAERIRRSCRLVFSRNPVEVSLLYQQTIGFYYALGLFDSGIWGEGMDFAAPTAYGLIRKMELR